MFRKQKHKNAYPIDLSAYADQSTQRKIVSSVEALDLDPERAIIVGSAALLLYGITPLRYDYEPSHIRPRDVDLTTDFTTFSDLATAGHTQSGLFVQQKQLHSALSQHVLRIESDESSRMPVDVITRYHPDKNQPQEFDDGFYRYFQANSHVIPGATSGVRVASLEHIEKELRRNRLDPKSALDLATLQQHKR